jgi:hypothetical protein
MLVPGLSVFVSDVPEYFIQNGHIHIRVCGTEMVMPVNTFMQGMAKSRKVLDEWFDSQQPAVIPIRSAGY